MTANIRGLNMATRNTNDGISMALTAEGALDAINDNLHRIRVLSVQAVNGTNNDKDLASIQLEIEQRLAEIDRISEQTDFNGINLLGNGAKNIAIQVGAHDGQTIDIEFSTIMSTNISAARSRIEDADYAVEISNMLHVQIKQQISMWALAQANQTPNMILTLLQQSLGK